MSWRMRIQHRSAYRYADTIQVSYNEARLSPLDIPTQITLEHRVETTPAAPMHRYRDYWGTRVHAFDVHHPHTELVVTATSVVETSGTQGIRSADTLSWEELTTEAIADRLCEHLAPTRLVDTSDELAALSEELRGMRTPIDAVLHAEQWVHETLAYRRGETSVDTSASEALAARRGVCQDLAHVALAVLRGAGIPARYVSGYVHPSQDAAIGELVDGESHAWIEAWLGDWQAVDPTSGNEVGHGHVVVARGRDYADVPPLKGVYQGGRTRDTEVSVSVQRLA
jgi:transglutaminase-like putative cysteine protease